MFKNSHSGNIIIAGFICAVIALSFLIYKTTQVSFDVSVKGDYYNKEKNYNQQISAQKAGIALGNQFSITENNEDVIVKLPPHISQTLQNGQVLFFCYTNSGLDVTAPLPAGNDGIYLFNKEKYMKGKNYKVVVTFTANNTAYYKEARF